VCMCGVCVSSFFCLLLGIAESDSINVDLLDWVLIHDFVYINRQ